MDKLTSIRQQKQQLKKRIMQLEGQKVPENNLTEEAMAALYEKKTKIQHQRLEQQKYRKMQAEYSQRKAQQQRQKQLQRVRNEKRMIQLEVGMKKIVLNGVQQKVKGINSDQLLTRAMLSNPSQPSKSKFQINKSKQEIKNQFQKYLTSQTSKKLQSKYNLYSLNQKRFQLFQQKQIMLMREILLKQVINNSQSTQDNNSLLEDIDIMKCTKEELQNMLEENGIDIEDYMHPLNSKEIMDNYPKIQASIRTNISFKKQQMQEQNAKLHKQIKEKTQLGQWVDGYPNQNAISDIKKLIDRVVQDMVFNYQKRHFASTTEQKAQRIDQLKKDYQKIHFENEYYDLAEQFVSSIEAFIKQQILQETAEQINKLHEFTHDTTALSFDWLFNKRNYLEYRQSDPRVEQIRLQFKDESENIRFDKKQNQPTLDANKDQSNIFQTEKSTSQLINDIKLLAAEEQFFQQVQVEIKRQINQAIDESDFRLFVENGVHVVTNKGIKLVSEEKDTARVVINFQKELKNIKTVKKLNNLWILQTNDAIYVQSQWNIQKLTMAIGERINSPCGSFSSLCIYPTFSILGSLCNVVIGFEKGQVMKYNFNRNRVNSIQTNITHYLPLGPSIKTGDQAAFPLNNRNVIEYRNQKVSTSEQMHQFRQFFDHHSSQLINICYYKDNMFVTVDKSLHCSIWLYDMRRGTKSYQPYYTFQIRCQYKIYKQSQNVRFKDLYPSANTPQSPQEMYKKWMENETYLKLQIYNNPKKNSAYFRSPKWDPEKNQQPLWKITYDEKAKRLVKIFETFYNIVDGKIECKQVKVWRQYVIFLVQKQHVMRNDLKTVKIYVWSIQQRKLRTVAIQFDTFQQQKYVSFSILQNSLQKMDFPIVATISSGKILFFSMLSGQLLKDISQQESCALIRNYNFTSLQRGIADNFYGVTRRTIVQFIVRDKNSKQKKQQFNKIIQISRKKYNNLV